jgi:uncharacterized Tic20 family protein
MNVDNTPSRDERIMAGLAHGAIVVGWLGLLAGLVIWLQQREKSPYVAFQALQAVAYQFVGTLVTILCWICWGVFYALSFVPLMVNSSHYRNNLPIWFWLAQFSLFIPLILMWIWGIYGLWGGLRAIQGKDFQYFVLGPRVKKYMENGKKVDTVAEEKPLEPPAREKPPESPTEEKPVEPPAGQPPV